MKPKEKICKIILLSFLIFFFAFDLSAENMRGPVFSNNQVLNQMIFFHFYPLRADIADKGLLITDYVHSSVIRARVERKYQTWSDYELSHLTLSPFYRISEKTELSLNIGLVSYWGGFLDRFIQEYHHTFGFPNGQRPFVSNFETNYITGTMDHKIVDRKSPTSSLRDTSAMIRYQLIKTGNSGSVQNFSLSAAAGVEYPTGSVPLGTSNGALDTGAALYFEKELFIPQLYIYYLTALVREGTYKDKTLTMPTRNLVQQHSISFEILPSDFFSAVIQVDYSDSAYKESGNYFLDEAALDLFTAVNLRFKKQLFQLSMTEDLSHKSTADICVQFTYQQKF